MFEPNREELAWAAGFFDGEGSISVSAPQHKHSIGRALKIAIAQVDRRPLDRFIRAMGNVGNVKGPYKPLSKGRLYYEFQTTKFEDVQAIVGMLWTFLSQPKREKARHVLARYHELGNRPHGNTGWHRGKEVSCVS